MPLALAASSFDPCLLAFFSDVTHDMEDGAKKTPYTIMVYDWELTFFVSLIKFLTGSPIVMFLLISQLLFKTS